MYKVGINIPCQQYNHVPSVLVTLAPCFVLKNVPLQVSASGDMREDPTIRTGSPAQIILPWVPSLFTRR